MAGSAFLMEEIANSRSIFTGGDYGGGPDLNIPALGPLGALMNKQLIEHVFKPAGLMPAQFFPTQGLYDQIQNKRMAAELAKASEKAAAADKATYVAVIRGAAKMAGRPFGDEQEKAANALAQDISALGPTLMAAIGVEDYDDLHGSRGSAAALAQGMARGGRYALDPITGRTGMSGESVGAAAGELHRRFFGPGSDPTAFRGLSAGRVGAMYDEMQLKGMIGPSLSAMTASQQRDTLARDPDTLADSMKTLRVSNKGVYEGLVADMEKRRPGEKGLRALAPTELDRRLVGDEAGAKAALDKMEKETPGELADAKRRYDGKKIGDRLANLSGAVSAMRDVFGDAGRPNAPMRELIDGLDKLTQGGMATMSPAQLEKSVRMTQALAKSTGVSVDGMMALTAHIAKQTDDMGIERVFAAKAVQGGIAFGQAFGQVGRGDVPNFQGRSKEDMTIMSMQLQARASNSGLANQLGATVRAVDMLERQGIAVGGDAKLLAEAIKAGKSVFTDSKGRKDQSVFQTQDAWKTTMRDAGFSDAVISQMARQKTLNREPGDQYDIGGLVRRDAQRADVGKLIAQEYRGAIATGLTKTDLKGEAANRAAMITAVAASKTLLGMDGADLRDGGKRDALVADAMRKSLVAQGVDISRLTKGDLISMANSGYGSLSDRVPNDPKWKGNGTALSMIELQSKKINDRAGGVIQEQVNDAAMRTALAGLGRAGPLARIADTIIAAPDTAAAAAGKILGGVDPAAIKARMAKLAAADPATLKAAGITDKEQLAVLVDQVAQATAAFSKAKTPEEKAAAVARVEALVGGGDKARDMLAKALKAGGFKNLGAALSSAKLPAAAREWLTALNLAADKSAEARAGALPAEANPPAAAAQPPKADAKPGAAAAAAKPVAAAAKPIVANEKWSLASLAGAALSRATTMLVESVGGGATGPLAAVARDKVAAAAKGEEGDDAGKKSQMRITGTLTIPGVGAGVLVGRAENAGGRHGSTPIAMV